MSQTAEKDACDGCQKRPCVCETVVLPSAENGLRLTTRRGGKNLRIVERFNEVCPVGSPVFYWPGVREGEPRKGVTRSEAWLLGGHTPVVMVEGYAGGIALSHVMGCPIPPGSDPQ